MTTAKPLRVFGLTLVASTGRQGGGLIDAYAALHADNVIPVRDRPADSDLPTP